MTTISGQTPAREAAAEISATSVDLPDLGLDLFHAATDRMISLVTRPWPATSSVGKPAVAMTPYIEASVCRYTERGDVRPRV